MSKVAARTTIRAAMAIHFNPDPPTLAHFSMEECVYYGQPIGVCIKAYNTSAT